MSSDSKISRFAVCTLPDSLRIHLFFNSEERIQKYQDLLQNSPGCVDGSRIWKEKAADPKISGYVWTGLKSCSSVCLGLSDLYVRFWKLLPQKNVSAGSDIFYLTGRGR